MTVSYEDFVCKWNNLTPFQRQLFVIQHDDVVAKMNKICDDLCLKREEHTQIVKVYPSEMDDIIKYKTIIQQNPKLQFENRSKKVSMTMIRGIHAMKMSANLKEYLQFQQHFNSISDEARTLLNVFNPQEYNKFEQLSRQLHAIGKITNQQKLKPILHTDPLRVKVIEKKRFYDQVRSGTVIPTSVADLDNDVKQKLSQLYKEFTEQWNIVDDNCKYAMQYSWLNGDGMTIISDVLEYQDLFEGDISLQLLDFDNVCKMDGVTIPKYFYMVVNGMQRDDIDREETDNKEDREVDDREGRDDMEEVDDMEERDDRDDREESERNDEIEQTDEEIAMITTLFASQKQDIITLRRLNNYLQQYYLDKDIKLQSLVFLDKQNQPRYTTSLNNIFLILEGLQNESEIDPTELDSYWQGFQIYKKPILLRMKHDQMDIEQYQQVLQDAVSVGQDIYKDDYERLEEYVSDVMEQYVSQYGFKSLEESVKYVNDEVKKQQRRRNDDIKHLLSKK